jgi:ATP-dependent Clp protease ATP-binding subunit ClpC
VFERFTDRARRTVVLAQEEARLLNHNYIGTEHLLLGMARDSDSVAARAMTSLGVSLETLRSEVEGLIGRGDEAPGSHIPFTPRAKKVLEYSLREALQLHHNYIGTEHILLGLIREGEGVAAQVLERHIEGGVQRVREAVLSLVGASGAHAAEAEDAPLARRPPVRGEEAVVESLLAENAMLRDQVDRLRHALMEVTGREGDEPDPPPEAG